MIIMQWFVIKIESILMLNVVLRVCFVRVVLYNGSEDFKKIILNSDLYQIPVAYDFTYFSYPSCAEEMLRQ